MRWQAVVQKRQAQVWMSEGGKKEGADEQQRSRLLRLLTWPAWRGMMALPFRFSPHLGRVAVLWVLSSYFPSFCWAIT